MVKVERLPGRNCVHNKFGHCLREETGNPGFRDDWLCPVLRRLEIGYDDLVNRAEAFNLPEKTAADILERRMESLARRARDCPGAADQEEGFPATCPALAGNACIRLMPRCEGICRWFRHIGSE